MPRGPLTQETLLRRAQEKIREALGYEIELDLPNESEEDRVVEAESVITYFEVRGKGFKKIPCRNCGKIFAYSYHIDGVKHCSVECIAQTLRKMGLKWDPLRSVDRRWGLYRPAVVPPSALNSLLSLVDTQENLLSGIDP